MAFPGHCDGFAVFIIKPYFVECESLLRLFPNEQDEISCTCGIGCVGITKKSANSYQVSTFILY